MGPMSDDEEMVTRPAATTPARSDSPGDPGAAGEGSHPGKHGENVEAVEEGPGLSGLEEAGYGYGV
jgi:hypothetical protein